MEIYNFKEERSLFGLKDSFIAALPYIILIISRLIRSIIFFIDSSYILEYGLLDRLAAYATTYINAFDIALCLIPVLILLFEKRSLLVRFHAFQYLVINTFIPLIYLLIISIIFMIMGMTQTMWTTAILFMYGAMMFYGLYSLAMTFIQGFGAYRALRHMTTDFKIVSSIAYRLATIGDKR